MVIIAVGDRKRIEADLKPLDLALSAAAWSGLAYLLAESPDTLPRLAAEKK